MALIFILKRNLMWLIDISMVFHMTSLHQTTVSIIYFDSKLKSKLYYDFIHEQSEDTFKTKRSRTILTLIY